MSDTGSLLAPIALTLLLRPQELYLTQALLCLDYGNGINRP